MIDLNYCNYCGSYCANCKCAGPDMPSGSMYFCQECGQGHCMCVCIKCGHCGIKYYDYSIFTEGTERADDFDRELNCKTCGFSGCKDV
ncbi:MAG: hypothetical protein LBU60_06190 [Clostridiales bacterium]|jgi:hypothetical protein|nr:hypothetical protein [Clostridiales bacterium]